MDDIQLDDLLKRSDLFSPLDDEVRKKIIAQFTRVELKAQEVLFYQGDYSDDIYLLASGKLSAQLMTGMGETKNVGYVDPAESVGEIGAFTNEARSLTIRAVKDSVLYKMSAKDFKEIIHQYPAVMFAMIHPLIARSDDLVQLLSSGKRRKHIVIVPANKTVTLEVFYRHLKPIAEKFTSTLMLSEFEPEFQDVNMSDEKLKEIIQARVRDTKSNKRVIYVLKNYDSPLAKHALKRVNSFYIMAYGNSTPDVDKTIIDHIEIQNQNLYAKPSLVLLYHDKNIIRGRAAEWLKLVDFRINHHVSLDSNNDMQSLFRFIRGKAVGVVLGGGGTRGWAHLGVIKAMREAHIPIDIIGGTSVGALVGGMYAMTKSYQDLFENFKQLIIQSRDSVSWRSLTWPIMSLFNAENYTNSQMEIFGDRLIEDLPIPFFCISSNLSKNTEDIHQQGILWEKTRASTAIPGIIPPMLLNGEVHLDGGLLNNLPVDVMRQIIGERGKIISVELSDYRIDNEKYNFPPVIKFRDVLLSKLGFKTLNYQYPSFLDTFLHGLFLGSMFKDKHNSLASNIFVSLDLHAYSLLHSNPEQGAELIQIGYDEMVKQLESYEK